ncbi:MAG: hypothetical protein DRJ42_04660 [Deltaproteobacteria bacterium]|nr:MAG: hypothetical protein DRJ42_04660 [Deltaproteobacteria bacterium]
MTSPTNLRDTLASEIAPIHWRAIEGHHRRGALFIVDVAVELVDVALAMAEDRTDAVKGWLDAAHIARPTGDDVDAWTAEEGARFLFVIVQPYVLAQRLNLDVGDAE